MLLVIGCFSTVYVLCTNSLFDCFLFQFQRLMEGDSLTLRNLARVRVPRVKRITPLKGTKGKSPAHKRQGSGGKRKRKQESDEEEESGKELAKKHGCATF